LGYALFDNNDLSYSYKDMDGQTTRGAKAAQIATRKGLLLVVAMGNDGNNSWHYLATPADADSILSVGAVNTAGIMAPFSSYGPTSDGRLKPEVCAVGLNTALVDATNKVIFGDGTSFACPQIAGMAACIWSANPKASNMDIRQRIIESSDRYANPDDRYGYGIPNAWVAYENIRSASEKVEVESKSKKVLIEGQLYIQHNNEYFNVLGNKIAIQ
jgi:subtilisin family serine protease